AIVVLALVFGVLRPALRSITGTPKKPGRDDSLEPHSADVQLVDDGEGLPQLGSDRVHLSGQEPLALPVDSYEERL
ncbi:hypothetical protein B8W90_13420, partial [Staphylococcus hominis]